MKKAILAVAAAGFLLAAAAFSSAGGRPAVSRDRFLDPGFWRDQALRDLIPFWDAHARDAVGGAFFMNLSRTWRPLPPWDKVPALVSRHVFGFSAAYLLSGEERYLATARRGADYLFRHAWDPDFGGWFDKLDREGRPLVESKSVALQLYTNVGLTGYYLTTGDARALSLVRKSVDIQRSRGRDAEFGGYVQALRRDLGVLDDGKNKHAHYGYVGSLLLNLYLATRDPDILSWEKELMDLTLDRMRDKEGWIHGFRSRFDRRWTRTPAVVEGREVVSVGAELTAALAFLRLARQSGDRKYLEAGLELGRRLTRLGFDRERGVWHEFLDAAPPHAPVPNQTTWWWVQIYGAFLELQLYRATGDGAYLDGFVRTEAFFDRAYRDKSCGGVFGGVTPAGLPAGDGRKASDGEWHTSYHEMEHALLNYLFLSLWVRREPAVLHFRLDGPGTRFVSLIDDPDVRISSVRMDGRAWTAFDAVRGSVEVPPGPGHAVEVVYAPGPPVPKK